MDQFNKYSVLNVRNDENEKRSELPCSCHEVMYKIHNHKIAFQSDNLEI